MRGGDIYVISGPGQGHLFPCLELCRHLASRDYHTTLFFPSSVHSSVPDLTSYPLIDVASFAGSSGPPMMPGSDPLLQQGASDLESHLLKRSDSSSPALCAIIDFQVGWSKGVFWKFNIPAIGFFTFGACAAAMEWAGWKAEVHNMKPGEIRLLPGLPDEMALSYSELKRGPSRPPPGRPSSGGPPGTGGMKGSPSKGGPPKPGDKPPWVDAVEGSVALMFNTSDDLERPFLNYMTNQMGMPAWGVGPLLPEQYWKSSGGSLIRDREVRSHTRQTNFTEEEILQWLDSKPRGSVLYVAFGSEVGPTMEEYPQLAEALEESTRPYIWVIQSESEECYFAHELDSRVGERGLIIHGWAPQLLILSHPSTGGFLSHCGWNSTAEAIGRGVPIVAWPRRGDQHYNAKLVVNYLQIGYMATSGDASEMHVKNDDILKGIERLMGDEEVRKQAAAIRVKFERGFPSSSEVALDAFVDFICQKAT